MDRLSVKEARDVGAVGRQVTLQGWIRTRRDSKGGFSFLELNDGSCLANIQVIADASLANYEAEVKQLAAGCSVTVRGEVKASGGKGQATEVQAVEVVVHGWADPETYPLQKKRHSFEKLREWAHLRPRTNTFGAIARVRNRISRSIHDFFQEEGFLYLNSPIITASDCEGAGAMFRVTTLDPAKPPRTHERRRRLRTRFFQSARVSHGVGPIGRRDLRHGARQDLYVWADISGREFEHDSAPRGVLDGRAGNCVL